MHKLPSKGLPERNEPKPRHDGLRHYLRFVSLLRQLAGSKIRPQRDGVSAHQWARQRALRLMPYQQQLQSANCLNRLWQRAVPPDDLAENEQSGARDSGSGLCRGQLRPLPHHKRMGRGIVRSQLDRICADGHALLTYTNALHRLPYQ